MNRRMIDLETYPRRGHFAHFLRMDNPFVEMTAEVDITAWHDRVKREGLPFFLTFQYAVVHAANRIPAFRQRILDGGIVEYAFCDPSYTVARDDGTYGYCLAHADQPFDAYLAEAREKQRGISLGHDLAEEGDVLGQLFITCVPWISYTAVHMPWPDTRFSNPSIGWGRYVRETRLVLRDGRPAEQETVRMPVTVMANHALVDGIHLAQFYQYLDEELAKR